MSHHRHHQGHSGEVEGPEHEYGQGGTLFMDYQLKILFMYTAIYVLVDFGLRLAFDIQSSFWKEAVFIAIIVASVIHDLRMGPSEAHIPALEENVLAMSRILISLFILILASACLTNQFVSPVELETSDGAGDEGNSTLEYLWEMDYKGFNPLTLIGDTVGVFTGWVGSLSGEEEAMSALEGSKINLGYALIHLVVDTTKVAVARLLILEGELIMKLLIHFYTTI